MDILIKNLKMPIGERKVVLILKSDGEVSVYEDKHGLVRFTDALELPEHGDLIDRDALADSIPEAVPDGFENCRNCTCMTKDEMVDIIVDAPVVLEAST